MNQRQLAGVYNRIDQFLTQSLLRPCLLLAIPDIQTLQGTAEEIFNHYQWPTLDLARGVSEHLLYVSPTHRPRKTPGVVSGELQALTDGPVLCVNIDLLFDPSLTLDPLHLLREQSRHRLLLVAWPGSYSDGILSYAKPTHSHYRSWEEPAFRDDCIITL